MSLPGKTASRFLLAAARVVVSNEQFTNGYLPDFRGNKSGRIPIPQESVDKLRGSLARLHFNSLFNRYLFAEAVRMRFGFKEEDMNSIWGTIRTSLVQKVSDVRKSEKRSTQSQTSDEMKNASSERNEDVMILDVNNGGNQVGVLD